MESDILKPQVQEQAAPEVQPTGAISQGDAITTIDLKQYFSVHPYVDSDAITYIGQFLQSRGITSKGSAFQILRDIELKLGQQDDRPQAIYNYLKILNQRDDLDKQLNSLHGIR